MASASITLEALTRKLEGLGFEGCKRALLRQSDDPNYAQLPFEARLYQLLEAEEDLRRERKIKRLLTQARLKEKEASLDRIESAPSRNLERAHLLSLASNAYLRKKQNLLITGPTGVGKSFLAQALARQAIFDGYSVRYYRVARLLEEIRIARIEATYTKTLQKLAKFHLLILDDFGVTPLTADELNDLFEVIEERTLTGSTLVTAQLPVKEWHAYLGNATLADAMMDRLIHGSHRIELKGESMRKRLAKG